MFNEYSEFYNFKKRIATLIVAILFLLFSLFFRYLRKDMREYKLSNPIDFINTMNTKNNVDLSSYLVINSKLIEFANNPNEEENSYYMMFDNDKIYIIFGDKQTIDNIHEDIEYKIHGVTKKITNKFKEVIIEAYKERYNKELTLDDFGTKVSNTYLSTIYTEKDLTTGYNTLIIIFDLMTLVTFVYGFLGAIIRGVRRE